jgi:cytochrome P450
MDTLTPCGYDRKTSFSNKMGVYNAEDHTVTWTADNGVRIVSYLKGRGETLSYKEYDKDNYLGVMIANAKRAFENHAESIYSQAVTRGTWPLTRSYNFHIVFDPHLTPVVSSFTRYPQDDSTLEQEFNPQLTNDLATPYNTALSKASMQRIGLQFSTFSLPPDSYAVIHKSIADYLNTWNGNYSAWADFADEMYFKSWSSEGDFIEGLSSFSSMAWSTVSKFILGYSEEEFVDYAHVWNTLLQSTKGMIKQGFATLYYFPELKDYILKKIREIKTELHNKDHAQGAKYPETIIHFWLRNNIAGQVVNKLTSSMHAQAMDIAQKQDLTLEELVYLDNFLAVMAGMQENIAFTLTQIAYHFARDRSLKERCRHNEGDCKKMVREVLRFTPPAGTARGLRWDSDVIDPIKGKSYRANKGDLFVTMPAVTMHLDAFCPKHAVFDIDRSHVDTRAFSEGPHRCPGQITALNWLYLLTHKLSQYEFSREGLEEPTYYNAFILRDGDMQFKMS